MTYTNHVLLRANIMMSMRNCKTVSLVYGYSARNAGDFAITLGAIDTLLDLGVKVKLFSRYCAKNEDFHKAYQSLQERYGDAVEIYECPFNLDRTDNILKTLQNYLAGMLIATGIKRQTNFRSELLDCDMVIFNGGNLFRCRSFIDFARLTALTYPLRIARKAKKPYIIFPQSASILNVFGQMLLKPVLQDAKVVMLREEDSYNYLCKLVPNAEFFKTIDLAFFIDKAQLPKTDKDYTGYIAFTLRFHTVGDITYLSEDKIAKTLGVLSDVVEKMKETHKVVIVVQTEKDEKLSRKFAQKHNVELFRCQDVPTLISLYKQVDLLVGMRLHSMILAISTGTPCMGVFYKEWGLKNPGLMSMFNMPYYFLDGEIKPNDLIQTVENLLRNRKHYSKGSLSLISQSKDELSRWLRQVKTEE